jgi:exodeoxyribonuclease V gamma subunit
MLHLHFSNRLEILTRLIVGELGADIRRAQGDAGGWGATVFASARVIVPSQAVARALTLAIADAHGICANVEFEFLARWLWRQIAAVVPGVGQTSPFEPEMLSWHIYRALGEADLVRAYPRLQGYLREADELMRYELACRLAALYRDYSTYREDWLEAWADGRRVDPVPAAAAPAGVAHARADEAWQGALYRRIIADLGIGGRHPGSRFIDALRQQGAAALEPAGLPACVHVFALPTMPPQNLALLRHLGTLIDVHVYALNPCQEYWFEVVDRRRLTYLSARGRGQYQEEGNRLLANWGRQTQSHVALLVDQEGAQVSDDSLYERRDGDSLLARVQDAILDLRNLAPDEPVAPADRSLEVHDCHSLTRELEVLHDTLLDAFASDAALQPGDVLVVTPDLEAAAPLIDAVFGTSPQERRIPFQLTGRSRSTVNVPARTLLALLSLAASRIEATALFDFLQQPLVARRFGLDEADLQQVRDWIASSGFRWGLDDRHQAGFDVPGQYRHTLADAMERLFLGYALPDGACAAPLAELLPAGDPAGSRAFALGALWRFVAALRDFQARIAVAQGIDAWGVCLTDALATFLAAGPAEIDDLGELQLAIDTLGDTLRRGLMQEDLPLAVIRAALEGELDQAIHGGVPTGQVTFTSMASLRCLPFDIICVIGLNDGAFPTAVPAAEFDLMGLQVRAGDRQRALDERNVFLDLVLAARRRLYLSYCGHSVRDNSILPPSVLIAELLDTVRAPVFRHPLQPFAAACFAAAADSRLQSYNREMGEALRASRQAPLTATIAAAGAYGEDGDDESSVLPQPPFFTGALAPPDAGWQELTLEQLLAFFRNPSRYLLARRMGIELRVEPDELQDQEPFSLERRARRQLANRLLPRLIERPDENGAAALIAAGTEMPTGNLGAFELQRELSLLSQFAARVRARTEAVRLAPHRAAVSVEVGAGTWRLSGGYSNLGPGGQLRWSYSEERQLDALRASDALDAWIGHLLLCADPPPGMRPQTTVIAMNGAWSFRAPGDPRAILTALLDIYRQGLTQPLHFFPRSAWAYMLGDQQLSKAQAQWEASDHKAYAESTDHAYALALRGVAQPLDGEFRRLAAAVFGPLLAHQHKQPLAT